MNIELHRRQFLSMTAGAVVGALMGDGPALAASSDSRVRAIAFDAFPIFDPRSVVTLAENLYPGNGTELTTAWQTRQFEYTWLRVAAQRYTDFWRVTADALEFSAAKLKLELSADKRDKLLNAYLALKPWPDVPAALDALKQAGFRLAFLSNFTQAMLNANIKGSGLTEKFEQVLSTDLVRTFKPDPRAYQLGVDTLKLRREEILFVAHAGWDAAGAKLFGYPTFWINRQKLPAEKLDATPDGVGESLTELVRFLNV